jgi:CBS domain containing-hemolysin-like protein
VNDSGISDVAVAAAAGAVIFFVVEACLAVVLLAAGALSRVAIHRVAMEFDPPRRHLDELRTPHSLYAMAVSAGRLGSLLVASLLSASAAASAGSAHPLKVGLLAGLVVGIILGEGILARAVVGRQPERALRATSALVRPVYFALYAIVWPVARLARAGARARSEPGADRDGETGEDVDAYIEVGEREGILEAGEGAMVRGIVDLGETRVREIMTARTDIVALQASASIAEARKLVLAAGHSRFPVYREGIDNVVGVIHVRDLLQSWEEGVETETVADRMRPAFFVPETQSTRELLAQIRTRTQIAFVVDEYGGLAGLVTLEDVLEEIVGDIREEHEADRSTLEATADGAWLVSGLAHVEELQNVFGLDLGERNFDTVGGLVVATFGRVPAPGESTEIKGILVEVLEADRRRVYRVRVRKADPAADSGSAEN